MILFKCDRYWNTFPETVNALASSAVQLIVLQGRQVQRKAAHVTHTFSKVVRVNTVCVKSQTNFKWTEICQELSLTAPSLSTNKYLLNQLQTFMYVLVRVARPDTYRRDVVLTCKFQCRSTVVTAVFPSRVEDSPNTSKLLSTNPFGGNIYFQTKFSAALLFF